MLGGRKKTARMRERKISLTAVFWTDIRRERAARGEEVTIVEAGNQQSVSELAVVMVRRGQSLQMV